MLHSIALKPCRTSAHTSISATELMHVDAVVICPAPQGGLPEA